jgi:hypothetical protein
LKKRQASGARHQKSSKLQIPIAAAANFGAWIVEPFWCLALDARYFPHALSKGVLALSTKMLAYLA